MQLSRVEKFFMGNEELKVLVLREQDYWIAQCLEYDIAVQARSLPELQNRFMRVFAGHVALAVEHNDRPFSNIEPPPSSYQHLWEEKSSFGRFERRLDLESPQTTSLKPRKAVLALVG